MILNTNIILTIMLLAAAKCFGQLQQTPIDQLESKQDSSARPVVVFIQTDWCKYCAAMKNTTFKNEEAIRRINKDFYFVSLDGEMKSTVDWKGESYNFLPTGNNTGYHELARKLGEVNGQLNYPVTVILNEELEIIHQQVGFISAMALVEMLESVTQ